MGLGACVHVCVGICLPVHICVRIHMCVDIHLCVYVGTDLHRYTHAFPYMKMILSTHTYTQMNVDMHPRVHMHALIYMQTLIHTYTQVCAYSLLCTQVCIQTYSCIYSHTHSHLCVHRLTYSHTCENRHVVFLRQYVLMRDILQSTEITHSCASARCLSRKVIASNNFQFWFFCVGALPSSYPLHVST